MSSSETGKVKTELSQRAAAKGYSTVKRHIFLCSSSKCAEEYENSQMWRYLKQRLKAADPDGSTAQRTKADCLRICRGGPLCLVYPEGTFYGNLTEKKLDRIIDEHLIGGQPVEELAFHEHPLDD